MLQRAGSFIGQKGLLTARGVHEFRRNLKADAELASISAGVQITSRHHRSSWRIDQSVMVGTG
jgi:hypothetical protein